MRNIVLGFVAFGIVLALSSALPVEEKNDYFRSIVGPDIKSLGKKKNKEKVPGPPLLPAGQGFLHERPEPEVKFLTGGHEDGVMGKIPHLSNDKKLKQKMYALNNDKSNKQKGKQKSVVDLRTDLNHNEEESQLARTNIQ